VTIFYNPPDNMGLLQLRFPYPNKKLLEASRSVHWQFQQFGSVNVLITVFLQSILGIVMTMAG
jgi:hypothetical protein